MASSMPVSIGNSDDEPSARRHQQDFEPAAAIDPDHLADAENA